jgi:hypothetical protein
MTAKVVQPRTNHPDSVVMKLALTLFAFQEVEELSWG